MPDPDAAITQVSAFSYIIDEGFVDEIRDDPNVLWFDETRLTEVTGGTYAGCFSVTTEGDLSDALGWQQYDIILKVNNYWLKSVSDVLDAFVALSTETEFEVVISRGTGPNTVIEYEIQ
jgi:type II secretory pathway component PulC